ncbi:MAG: hypothetical protein PHS88_04260 [Candidatus Omnitrophica bacterium]|nr:hypothetical protein [Candidatus Omnitrophota bacterium]
MEQQTRSNSDPIARFWRLVDDMLLTANNQPETSDREKTVGARAERQGESSKRQEVSSFKFSV